MDYAGDRPRKRDGQTQGEPGSEDEFARGATTSGVPDVGADVADGDGARTVDEQGRGEGEGENAGSDAASGTASDAVSDERRALDEQREKYLRLAAEYDNFRKRTQRERLDAGARAQAELVRQLLDSLDDLSRFSALDPSASDPTTVLEGVQLVERKLVKALTSAGLEILDPVDQTFDPSVHEAVATEPALSPEDDHLVARVYQPGYVFKGLLLRPARVVVKQWNG